MRYGTNDLNHYRFLLESFLKDRSQETLTVHSNKHYITTQKIVFGKSHGQLSMTTYDSSGKMILNEPNVSLYNAALQYQTVSDMPARSNTNSKWYRSTTRQSNATTKYKKPGWFSRENRYRRERFNYIMRLFCFFGVVLFVILAIIFWGGYFF